jgi:hypothetical protein
MPQIPYFRAYGQRKDDPGTGVELDCGAVVGGVVEAGAVLVDIGGEVGKPGCDELTMICPIFTLILRAALASLL